MKLKESATSIIFSQQIVVGKLLLVLIWVYNLIRLLFCPSITVNNNLPLKICCEKSCKYSISLKLNCDAEIRSNYVTLAIVTQELKCSRRVGKSIVTLS